MKRNSIFIVLAVMLLSIGYVQAQATSAAKINVPAEAQQLIDDFRQAVLSKDIERIAAYLASDYKSNGRSREVIIGRFRQNIDFISRHDMNFTRFEAAGNEAYEFNGSIDYGASVEEIPAGSRMVRRDGKWYWHGNQK